MPYKDKEKLKEHNKNYQEKNKGKILIQRREHYKTNREKLLLDKKEYYKSHIKEIAKRNKVWREKTKEKLVNSKKVYYQNNKEKINKKVREFYINHINFKIKMCIKSRIRLALKYNWKSGHTLELLGCSIKQLKEHLEAQFRPGMTWDNYGKWHIDHIRPCASFDLSKDKEQAKCFNYTNLQPLWAKENLSKGAKNER